jgi:predicted DNA-binding transcriptional regulator AlpA
MTPLAASIADTAAALGIGKTTLYDMIRGGTGPRTIYIGRRRVILLEDRDAWLAALRDRPQATKVAA